MEIKIWGKSKVDDREISLSQHINDVLHVFEHLGKKVPQLYLKELIRIIIKYHDAGKVLPYFQRKSLKNYFYLPFEVYTNIPHSMLSALLVDEQFLLEQLSTIFDGDCEKAETYSKYVLSAIAYHHWRENFHDIVEGNTDTFERLAILVDDKKKWGQIKENLKTVYTQIEGGSAMISINLKWLDGLNNGIRFADYVVPPYLLYRMPKRIELDSSHLKDWVLMSGFTMLSDHFASYMESEPEENISPEMVEMEGMEYTTIKEKITAELKEKLHQSYNEENIWQFQYVNQYKDSNTILLAPTGMGKTEFSWLWSDGIKFFYTLPLRTAVNQIFDRTQKIFGKDKAGILHSDADVHILGEGGETESIRIYELARQLSSQAIVSTGDQFFPYGLRPPSYEKIFAKFSYSRLIIDEVQAYDPKAAAIVVKFIEHVVQMGGKFLLMTATLPQFIQDEIEKRIYDVKSETKNYEELNLFKKDEALASFSKHKVQLVIEKYSESQLSYSNELINEIINKAKSNGGSRILVVLNTVKQAQAVFKDLNEQAKKSIDIRLFHSRFTQTHRKEKESELENFIGNNKRSRAEQRPKILVATQVVEASLDLDADYIYTELAPWDSLVQRMGRILREAHPKADNLNDIIFRRYKNEIPENVFIMVYDGKDKKGKEIFESGKGYVYHFELLSTSLKLLENGIAIKEKSISIPDLKKWNSGKKTQINLGSISLDSILFTESDKSYLVETLFAGLPDESRYLNSFYNMLQILDAGFMSDRKNDAQKVFREINDVNVIAKDKIDDFISDLQKFETEYGFQKKYAYTHFKKTVLSKYLISVQRNKVKEYLSETNHVPNFIRVNEKISDTKILTKLNKWLHGFYFVSLKYDDFGGLTGINDVKPFELF